MVAGEGDLCDFAKEVFVTGVEGMGNDGGDGGADIGTAFWRLQEHDLRDPAMILVVVVEAPLVGDPEADEQGDGHAHGETGDIDKGVAFVFAEVTPGDGEVVL